MRHVSVQQLSAFVDGALVGVSRELVTRHLTACGGCRERLVRWNANDVALRRVLAWEPDERTLEEWSSRVEMTITAERKGLPPPEFTELLHPVIAHAPEIDGERLNNAVQSARRARKGEAAPAPQASAPAPTPKPTPPAVSPPASRPEPIASPAVAPAAATEGRKPMPEPALPAPPAIVASEPPPKPVHAPAPALVVAPAPASASGHVPPWSEVSLPAEERGHEPVGPARYTSLRTDEPAPHHAESYAPYAEQRPHWRDRLEERRPLLLALTAVLLLVLAGSPLAPEVIRIPLPEHWSWRLPRVEFVRRDLEKVLPPPVDDAANRFAARVAAEPEIVPPKPIPPPVDSMPAAADTAAVEVKPAEPVAQSSLSITEPRPVPKRAPKPKKKAPPPEPEPEPEVLTWPESPGTFVPTRVTTSVQASPAPPRPASEIPVPGPVESEAEWPLLCGTVLDGGGVPFEGALVVLTGNALSVRTDRRGRFCVACPPGTQGIRVEAPGQQPFTRTVELKSGMVEISVSLTPDQ